MSALPWDLLFRGSAKDNAGSQEPLVTDKIDGCEWCMYQDICGFDERIPGYETNQPEKMDPDEIWKQMEEFSKSSGSK